MMTCIDYKTSVIDEIADNLYLGSDSRAFVLASNFEVIYHPYLSPNSTNI